ncbi:MAG: sugar ABC transporter substrate-binding protein [Pelagibacterium sp. SCN 63-23]|nr:MAG: sugar ABC transporter substrate-binding protein [Pelagibacterium sp. SCN 63-23]
MTKITRLLARAAMMGLAVAPLLSAGTVSAQEPVTLVISNSQWLDALRGTNLWNALLKYEDVAPHVTLEQLAIPSAQYADRITTELGAGQGPDIAIMQDGLFYAIAKAGLLVPLDAVVESSDALNSTNENGIVDGEQLGIAWQRAVYALIYNRSLLDAAEGEVPSDVAGLIANAEAVTAATGAVGFTSRHQISDFTGWYMDFQNWAYGFGVNWVDDAGNLTINTSEAVAAVAAFKDVYDSGIIPIGDDMPTQRTRFKENTVGFSIDNSGGTLNIATGGALASTDLEAAPLPFPEPGAHQQLFLGVSTHSDHQDEAIAFLEWLVSAEGQQALREASGPDALATDVPVTENFRATNPWADTFAELATTSRSTLIPGHEGETGPIMRHVMEALERVIIANEDPETALAAAQAAVDAQF